MLALLFEGAPRLAEVPEPRPEADQALVAVTQAGVCATDLAVMRGYGDFRGVMGHEMVGVVEAAPSETSLEGKRVVTEINVSCGGCPACTAGRRNHCTQRGVLGIRGRDGVFAQRLAVPVSNLHIVPEHVTDDAAVFTEPLAAALRILEQVEIGPRTKVGVLGDGKLGLLVAMAMATTGCELTVIGRHPRKLAIAGSLGAKTLQGSPTPSRDLDVVVEATGSPAGLRDALRWVRPQGTVVLKSTFAEPTQLDASQIVVDEIQLVGSRCGPFESALDALARQAVDPTPLIDERFELRKGLHALEAAARRGTLKILVQMA